MDDHHPISWAIYPSSVTFFSGKFMCPIPKKNGDWVVMLEECVSCIFFSWIGVENGYLIVTYCGMVEKSCTTISGWLKPKQNSGMFTTYQLVFWISLATIHSILTINLRSTVFILRTSRTSPGSQSPDAKCPF